MKTVVATLICLACLLAPNAPAQEPARRTPEDRPSYEVLLELLRAREAGLANCFVEYSSTPRDQPGVSGSYLHREFAFRAPDAFWRRAAKGHDKLPWTLDPMIQSLRVVGDHVVSSRDASMEYWEFEIGPDESIPGSARADNLLLLLGAWPLSGIPSPGLSSGAVFSVREGLEQGLLRLARENNTQPAPYLTLEQPGLESLKIDPQRGGLITQRELFGPEGELVQRLVVTSAQELDNGVWVPSTFENWLFVDGTPLAEPRVTHFEVARWSRNSDSVEFAYVAPPGAARVGPDGVPRQVVPGGVEHLTMLADRIRTARTESGADDVDTRSKLWRCASFGAIGFFLVLAAKFAGLRSPASLPDTDES